MTAAMGLAIAVSGITAEQNQAEKKAAVEHEKKEIVQDRKKLLQDKQECSDVKHFNKLQKDLDDATRRHAGKNQIDGLKTEVAAVKQGVETSRNEIARSKNDLIKDHKELRKDVFDNDKAAKDQKKIDW